MSGTTIMLICCLGMADCTVMMMMMMMRRYGMLRMPSMVRFMRRRSKFDAWIFPSSLTFLFLVVIDKQIAPRYGKTCNMLYIITSKFTSETSKVEDALLLHTL